MSQEVKQTLNEILENILQNHAALQKQINDQLAQLAGGQEQLRKFDVLIASLQVAIQTGSHLEAVVTQAGANALFSPTLPASASNDGVAGVDVETAIKALDDVEVPAHDRVAYESVG